MTASPLPYRFAPLDNSHDRATFSCGVDSLDRFLREQATQFARRNLAVTFVMVENTTNRLMGYYTLCQSSILAQTLPASEARRLPNRLPIPATLVGRLARDRHWRGRGIGGTLLADAVGRAYSIARTVAAAFVVLDAPDENAKRFYEEFGFAPFLDDPLHLYLPMGRAAALV